MKTKQLNDWLQVAASVGVILGLIFVALEVRETGKVAREQAISAMSAGYSNFLSRFDDPAAQELVVRAMEESERFSLEESLQLMSLYLELLNAAEADYVIGESRGLSADVSVATAFSTTVWMSNRHGRAFWEKVRYVYTPEFSALIDEGMAGGADGVALIVLKSIGEGVAGNLPSE